jgi:hypothetical protein
VSIAAFGDPVVPDVNCRFTTSCWEREFWIGVRSTALCGRCWKGRNLESSAGIAGPF